MSYLGVGQGVGAGGELTSNEEAFVQNIASLGYVSGDLLYYDGANVTRLGIGSSDQFLRVSSGIPTWETSALEGVASINGLTGDTQTFSDADDTNITLTIASTGTDHLFSVGWAGTLADNRISSSATWNAKQAGHANLTSLSALTYVSPSFVKMTEAGTFALDTATYLTSLSGAVLTDQTVGQTIGTTGARLTKLWATDITVTNAITGSVTGNAGTVTNGVYTTDIGVSVQAYSATLAAVAGGTYTGDDSIATVGTITAGTWTGGVIGAAYGGTGVANNAASTLTISGNFATTLTVSGITGVTLPTSGTLLTTTGSGQALTLARIGASTYSTVQHLQDVFHSVGWVSGGTITDNGDGTVAVTAGTGNIRATDSAVAQILFFDWAQDTSVTLTDNSINFVYVRYNGGSPDVVSATSRPSDYQTNVVLGSVYRSGTSLHIYSSEKDLVGDHAKEMLRFNRAVMPFARESGAVLSETGTRNIAITAGAFWSGLTRFTTSAFDSSVASTFSYFYRDGLGGWTEVTGQTQIDNTQYDDGDGTLGTLTANRYGVHWVYLENDSHVNVLYGQGDYTLAEAGAAQAPGTLPSRISNTGRIIGKIIIQKSSASFFSAESAFMNEFESAGVNVHNDLASIQGGTVAEYYHLTSAEYTGSGTGNFVRATSPTLVTPVLGVATATSINKLTLTAPATSATLTIADGKTLTASNTLTLTATDGSTLAIGTGGTLGSAAYTASTAYDVAGAAAAVTPTTLGLVIGTNVQAYNSNLTAINQALTTTSSPTFANLTITSFAANWTNASRTIADLGTITTADINGGTIDGTVIGGVSAAALTATTGTFSGAVDILAADVTPSGTTKGILNIRSSDAQAIDKGGSLTLGGYRDDAASVFRVFGAIQGNKAEGTTGVNSGYMSFSTLDYSSGNLTERMRLDKDGNVGIGTTAPGTELHIDSSSGNTEQYLVSHAGNSLIRLRRSGGTLGGETVVTSGDGIGGMIGQGYSAAAATYLNAASVEFLVGGEPDTVADTTDMPGAIVFKTTPDGSSTLAERMRINSAGNVGIGTTAPDTLLSVFKADGAAGDMLHFRDATDTVDLVLRYDGTSGWQFRTETSAAGGGTNPLTLLNSGNVGIGTTAPATSLHIKSTSEETSLTGLGEGNIRIEIPSTVDNFAAIGFTSATYPDKDIARIGMKYKVTGSELHFGTSNAYANGTTNTAMVINNVGNIGIGTTAPLRRLDINEATGNCLRLIYNDADGSAANYADFLVSSGGDLTITPSSGKIQLAENTHIALDPAGSADGKFTGITVTGTAGAALAFGDLIYLDPTDSRWELVDANAAAGADGDARGMIGMCVLAAAGDASATNILLQGIIRADANFPALTIGAPVYAAETAGDIVVAQPVTADVVIRVVGMAVTADEIFFNPSGSWITHI